MRMKSIWAILAAVVLSFVFAAHNPVVSPAAKTDKAKTDKPKAGDKSKKPPDDVMKALGDLIEHRFTPVIKDVKVGAAAANKPISITVTVAYDDSRAKDKVKQVRVFYSINNGKAWKKPVNLKNKGGSWTGSIPKQKKGTILYYIWVKDSRGNVTTEIPCNVTQWPPSNDKCMVSGAVDPDPSDDKTNRIGKDMDYWTVKVGMSKDFVYIQQGVEGKINKGTMNPTRINSYFSVMFDAAIAKEIDSLSALMNMDEEAAKKKFKGKEDLVWAMIYSPLGKSMLGAKKDCFAPRPKANPDPKNQSPMGNVDMNTTDLTCSAPSKSPNLFFRLKKSALPSSMQNEVVIVGGINMTVTNTEQFAFKLGDITNLTRAIYNPRTITVK